MDLDSNLTSSAAMSISKFHHVSDSDLRSPIVIGLCSVLFILIIVTTIVGNIVVIVAITNYRALKCQQSNLFILNLAMADLAVAFTVMIWSTVAFIIDAGSKSEQTWDLGMGMCLFQCAMNYCLIVVSMTTLGFISVDRFVHIVYPLRYIEIITVRRIRIMIVWTWIQGLIIGFIPVGMQWIHYDYCEVVCAIDWSSKHADIFVIVAFITCFMTPAITMLVCYSVIFKEINRSRALVKANRQGEILPEEPYDTGGRQIRKKSTRWSLFQSSIMSSAGLSSQRSRNASHNRRIMPRRHSRTVRESTIIKSLLIVVVVFFLCMTPFSVTKVIKVINGPVPCWVNTLATFIQLAASACNPFIYGIFRREYRRAFKAQYYKLCNRKTVRRSMTTDYSNQQSLNGNRYLRTPFGSKKVGIEPPNIHCHRASALADLNANSYHHQENREGNSPMNKSKRNSF